jgi:ADP-ribosylglycohydrolase
MNRESLIKDRVLCEDKAMGCMIGLAIGDALGDMARTPENHLMYGITMDFPESGGGSTDDTEFSLLTAKLLIDTNGTPTIDDVLQSWEKYVMINDELKRGGASEREAIENIKRGILPPDSGRYNSFRMSDGAAMRISPVGIIAAGDIALTLRLAQTEACISHWEEGIWGAQAVAMAVTLAMINTPAEDMMSTILNNIPSNSWLYHSLNRAVKLVEANRSIEDVWMPLHRLTWTEYKAAAPEAVTQALAIIYLTNLDFKKSIIYSANFGRDADTICALCGSICGARHGLSVIPQHWINRARKPSGICLPFTKDMDALETGRKLAQLIR